MPLEINPCSLLTWQPIVEKFQFKLAGWKVIWKTTTSGSYSSSSFCKAFHDVPQSFDSFWSNVWTGNAPPKVKTFYWQVLKGKMGAKSIIMERGLMTAEEAMCQIHPISPKVKHAATHHFEVECDSFNAINWTRDHNKVPWRMKFISNAIESYLRNNVGISFIHILWQANLVADGLTKIGVLRACNFKAYFDMGNTPRLNYS
ncbi:Uncharacterized protein TCM_020427 [Theobroma cacao]|uniref:Uncharacterized protein n=1 Tax=Theobroma cacao TaxID=3641 RepID=A0A061EM09_THECC|nr:Uncharacterized protein TCM_020427 [Theobroma cacao]